MSRGSRAFDETTEVFDVLAQRFEGAAQALACRTALGPADTFEGQRRNLLGDFLDRLGARVIPPSDPVAHADDGERSNALVEGTKPAVVDPGPQDGHEGFEHLALAREV